MVSLKQEILPLGQDFLFSVVFFPILEELKLLSWGIGCYPPFGYIEFDFGELLIVDSQAAHLAIGRQGSLDAPQVHRGILLNALGSLFWSLAASWTACR